MKVREDTSWVAYGSSSHTFIHFGGSLINKAFFLSYISFRIFSHLFASLFISFCIFSHLFSHLFSSFLIFSHLFFISSHFFLSLPISPFSFLLFFNITFLCFSLITLSPRSNANSASVASTGKSVVALTPHRAWQLTHFVSTCWSIRESLGSF